MKQYDKRGCKYVEVRPGGEPVHDKVAQDDSATEPSSQDDTSHTTETPKKKKKGAK